MKTVRKRRITEILIFLAIVMCSLVVFNPIYKLLENRLVSIRNQVISNIEKEFGIIIKYGGMSPSFFRKILVRDVTIYDAQAGDKIAYFSVIHFNYRISELIKRNPAAVISSVGIYDGTVDFNTSKNRALWEKISGGKTDGSEFVIEEDKLKSVLHEDLRETERIPFIKRIEYAISRFQNNIETTDIILRNILINYSTENLKSGLYISDGKINVLKEKTEFNLNSKLQYNNFTVKNFSDFKTAINISGSFYQKNLSASSIINFSDIKSGNISVPKISVFASYLNNVVSVTTLQDIHPIDIKGSWNVLRNSGTLNIECKDLQPIAIAFPNEDGSILGSLKNSEVTGFLNLNLSGKKEFTWNTKLNIFLPSFKLNGGNTGSTDIAVEALGDDNLIQINSFSAKGENINAFLSGSYKINEILPDFKLNIAKLKLPSMQPLSLQLNAASAAKSIFINIPKIAFGEAEVNNIRTVFERKKNKTDFYFNFNDKSGRFNLDGTLTHTGKNGEDKILGYLELHGAVDSIEVKNIYYASAAALGNSVNRNGAAENFIEQLKLTSEFYISSDFKNFSYNVIQTILASGAEDGFYALFSLNGNESSVEVNGIDLSFNKLNLKGSLNSSFGNGGLIFDSLLTLNDISYKASGLYENNTLNIYGDYGLNISVFKNENKNLAGNFLVKEFPMPFLNSVFSADLLFEYVNAKDWNFTCNFAKLEHLKSDISKQDENFEFEIAGAVTPKEAFFHTVKAGRKKSQLEGTVSFNLLPDSGDGLKKYSANVFISDADKREKIVLDSLFSFADKVYFDGKCIIENISLNRFFADQKKENKVNAEFLFLGSPETLSLKADLKELNYNLNGKPLIGNFTALLDDKQIIIEDTSFAWDIHKADKIAAEIKPEEGRGVFSFNYFLDKKGGETKASFYFDFNSPVFSNGESDKGLIAKLKALTSNYNVNMKISDWVIGGNQGKEPVTASLVREPNITAIYAGEGEKIYGFKTDDGLVSFNIDESLPIHLNIDGTFTEELINLNCSNIFIDMPTVMNYIPKNEIIKFYTGEITGSFDIKGTQKGPLFYGKLNGSKITCSSPKYSPDTYGEASVPITLDGTALTVPYTIVPGKAGRLWAEVTSEFIGWIPYYTVIKCGTVEDDMGILKTKNLAFHSDGKAKCDIVISINPEHINLEGSAYFDNGYFSVPFSELYKIEELYSGRGPSFSMVLNLNLGKKSEFRFPSTEFPFLRAIAYTEKPLKLIVDPNGVIFEIEGSAKIRTGEIFYIKRNFFVKEGNIAFVKSPTGTEPVISLVAEIRDKLPTGDPVTISLTAKDQYLDLERFNPTITTSPPMSDTERMMLIGQLAIGNANNSNVLKEALSSASDVFAQMGLLKKAEAGIRDFFHLDVLSMRTLVLQNVILGNLFKSSSDAPLTIGNYFDNTSVYIGKYFGSAIYADAMLHLSYYDPLAARKDNVRRSVYGNLLFQPEIGLEMNTPFFLLRWHIAPTRPDTIFVPDTGLTLSWKFFY
ncbi:hypothetical protein [Treponema pedis]|uniref:hypothetical protein n=1 Tax=Treponema pedis TaxID=409322 RepID=UPI00197F4461|nr:hypothetical protein [Treponema pedis]QSI03705.1 hypothetical protein DYQ05_01625 [Treponema pedis]